MDEAALLRRYVRTLHAARMGTFEYDPASGDVHWDEPFELLLGTGPVDHPRTLSDFAARVHPDDLDDVMERATACAEGRLESYQHDYRIFRTDGTTLWVRSTVVPTEQAGTTRRIVGLCADVTDHHRTEETRAAARSAERAVHTAAESSQRHLELLARVASLLETPPDLPSTLQRVAELAIDVLAEWCAVDLSDDEGRHRMAIAHRDPGMLRLAEEVERRWPARADDPARLTVVSSRQPLHIRSIDDDLLASGARSPEHLEMLRRFSMSSAVMVPVQAAGTVHGVLTLVATHGREISRDDVDLAAELGRRAGEAVERARLYAERERIMTALQRALLPPALPTIPGVDVAAAYEPAGAGAAVGGDFYDIFSTGNDRWWIMLGDVQGKGPEAAALTGTVRHVLGAVLHDTVDPAEALQRAQLTLQNRDLGERTASVVLATFRAGETPLEVHVAAAGHPPPLIRRAGADVEVVDSEGLLLGVESTVGATTVVQRLVPGDVMLLYTDGATDAPVGPSGRLGEDGLRAEVASAPRKPGSIVDTVAASIRGAGARRDDVALLAFGLPFDTAEQGDPTRAVRTVLAPSGPGAGGELAGAELAGQSPAVSQP